MAVPRGRCGKEGTGRGLGGGYRAGKAAKRKRCLSCVLLKMMKNYRQAHSEADPALAVCLSHQSDERKKHVFIPFGGMEFQ